MFRKNLQEQACFHALGLLTAVERTDFEQKLLDDPDLRMLTDNLEDITARLAAAWEGPQPVAPSPALKQRIMSAIEDLDYMDSFGKRFDGLIAEPHEAVVVTDREGLIQWVNHTFTVLTGYEMYELRGKKPSQVLQGKLTDQIAVQRIRDAIQSHKPWTEELVNYSKDGTPYWVSISISPILDENRQARCYVAIEHEIGDRPVTV